MLPSSHIRASSFKIIRKGKDHAEYRPLQKYSFTKLPKLLKLKAKRPLPETQLKILYFID